MAAELSSSAGRTDHSGHDLSLADAIAASTRAIHAKLNKSIIARLPLALPPRAPDPSVYACGLLHIAPIYTTFEALWQNMIDSPPQLELDDGTLTDTESNATTTTPDTGVLSSSYQPRGINERVHTILQRLHLPGLMRSERLKADIRALTGWPGHIVEEQLRATYQTGPLADFIAHIKDSIAEKPHVLAAYAYIMFMALFAGGRYIRASLESAGQDFWDLAPTPDGHADTDPYDANKSTFSQKAPFGFLHFDTPTDGEDLKREFKRRLVVSEHHITTTEKDDIVHETIVIFEHMSAIVDQLDDICGEMVLYSPETEQSSPTLSDLLQSTLPTRLRDSVAVTKERRVKNRSSKKSSSDDDSAGTVIRHRGEDRSVSSLSSLRSDAGIHDHPTLPAVTGIELCPAMASRAVRFDGHGPKRPQKRLSMVWEGDSWRHLATGFNKYVLLSACAAVLVAIFLLKS
jgi:heme oxygenase